MAGSPERPVGRVRSSLLEANRLLTMAEELAHAGHWLFENDSGEIHLSDEARRIFGFDRIAQPLTRDVVRAAYHPDDRERVAALIDTHVAAGTPFEFACRIVRPDGEERAVIVRGRCEEPEPGVGPVTFGIVLDVTEMRRAEEKLRATTAILTTTLETMDQGLMMVGADGVVQVCNGRAMAFLDLPAEMMQSRPTLAAVRAHQTETQNDFVRSDTQTKHWLETSPFGEGASHYERERPNGTVLEIRTVFLADGGAVRTYTDVTERRRAEAALREKTALLDVTLANMDQGLMMVDAQGVVRLCNRQASRLLDLPQPMMEAEPSFLSVLEYQQSRNEFRKSDEAFRAWVAGGGLEPRAHSYERERPDGTVLEIRTVPLPDGSAVRTYTDVTERKQSARRLQALTDALPQMVWVVRGDDGAAVYTNERFRSYLGDVGPSRRDRFAKHHPDDRERVAREWTQAMAEARSHVTEVRCLGRDGAYRWHKAVITPVREEDAVVEWIGTALDIEDMVIGREALRTSEERLAHALEAGSDGLWDCDLRAGTLWLSDQWWQMLGYAPGELEAHPGLWRSLLHPQDRPEALRLLAAHDAGRSRIFEFEHRLRHKNGGWAWFLTRGKIVARDRDPRTFGISGSGIGVTHPGRS